MKNILAITSVAFLLASGAAMAQTDAGSANPDTTTSDKQMSIEDPAMMAPFYTDATMSTLRAEAELKAAWDAMTADQQTQMKKDCETATSVKGKEFCGKVEAM